ncbi:MarR family winged helix-turn-helix transcriptional regulator [Anaerotignum sp.]|uniref:MarR family winged helix-turn-helix transcriptional regulator n=1 Tax=Anaerotignum sp. TaxID=2039241 RepID=UPI0028A924EC|nr:MarR family winged helix-turn-helix transcriptional regulator [Anaerotignum sp.]
MSDVSGKKIAELLITLNINLVCWSRVHLEQVFSTNGKGEEEKLTVQQFHILLHIRDFGLNTVSDISDFFCLSKSSISLSISKLVVKGYLKKESPIKGDDGRKIYFYLTEKGNEAVIATENALMDAAGCYFDSFDNETRNILCNHLTTINHLLSTGGTVK